MLFRSTATYEDAVPPTPTPPPPPPPAKYTLNVTDGSGSGEYNVGTAASITAVDYTNDGYRFREWIGDTGFLNNSRSSTAVFTGTTGGVEYNVTADYDFIGLIEVNVDGGTGSGTYPPGSTIFIVAGAPLENEEFNVWTGDVSYLGNKESANTSMTPPPGIYNISAQYATVEIGAYVYNLTVNGGSGGGTYGLNEIASVMYEDTGTTGTFNYWTGDTAGLTCQTCKDTSFKHYKTGTGPFDYTITAQAS